MQSKKIFLVISLLIITLQGCAPVVIGGAAAVGGALAYKNRQEINSLYQDTAIGNHIIANIKASPRLADSHIDVAVVNGNVLLAGQTPTTKERAEAQHLASQVSGVKRLYNQISISGAISILTQSSDSWITAKIKSEMILAKTLNSQQIKVVTENGVVFLMGRVTREQADIATDIARRVSGVQRVVRLFEYV